MLKSKIMTVAPFVLGAMAVVFLIIGFSQAEAQDAPSKTVQRIQKTISENQKIITKTRDDHIQFMTAKGDNDYQVRKLRELCYELNWTDNSVTKIEDCTAGDFLQ